jgi:UrcA family protein
LKYLGICAALLMTVPAAALAASPSEETTVTTVRYNDLNLSNAHDASVMMGRLDRAALGACGASQFSLREVREATRNEACYKNSLSQAVASLNAPSVTAIYRQRVDMRLASN